MEQIKYAVFTMDVEAFSDTVCLSSHGIPADVDVMDGAFVPNITFGPKMVADIRPHTKLELDTHLMIERPWNYIENFAKAGSDFITVHYEACKQRTLDTLKAIKSLGVKCGVVIDFYGRAIF